MGRRTRSAIALFDATAMVLAASELTGGRFGEQRFDDIVLWGSAIAASLVAVIVMTGGPSLIAWASIGYILHAALLESAQPNVILLALAVALMPVTPRPRGSLAHGIVTATIAAFGFSWLVGAVTAR